ncbi:MAG: hypothetical protein AAGB15_11665, partial [Pseudomonadota bacterium]
VVTIARGYIDGYYYIDPLGHRENSSIGAREFVPRDVPAEEANIFFRRLRRRYVRHGLSHRDQAPKGTVEVPEEAIAIMLQGLRRGEEPRGAICSEADMIRAVVAARGTRPVMIKFHPFGATPAVKRAVADVVDPKAGVHLVEANVHDVLEAASMVVTQTSGVGFEAILHRKPTVLFAAADYAHVATRVERLDDLPEILAKADQGRFSHAKYVYWFLKENLLRPGTPEFLPRVRQIIEDAAKD